MWRYTRLAMAQGCRGPCFPSIVTCCCCCCCWCWGHCCCTGVDDAVKRLTVRNIIVGASFNLIEKMGSGGGRIANVEV